MTRKLTGLLMMTLSLGIALNFAVSFRTVCAATLADCEAACHEPPCCETSGDSDCCVVIEEGEFEFVAPSPIPEQTSPFLVEVPQDFRSSVAYDKTSQCSPVDRSLDPPPWSGRALLSLLERHLI